MLDTISMIQRSIPGSKIVVWDLGLDKPQQAQVYGLKCVSNKSIIIQFNGYVGLLLVKVI